MTLSRWRATFAIQRDFETRMGQSIYACLPGMVETTFGGQLTHEHG